MRIPGPPHRAQRQGQSPDPAITPRAPDGVERHRPGVPASPDAVTRHLRETAGAPSSVARAAAAGADQLQPRLGTVAATQLRLPAAGPPRVGPDRPGAVVVL